MKALCIISALTLLAFSAFADEFQTNEVKVNIHSMEYGQSISDDWGLQWPNASPQEYLYEANFWVGDMQTEGAKVILNDFNGSGDWSPTSDVLISDLPNWADRPSGIEQLGDKDYFFSADDSSADELGPIGLDAYIHGIAWSNPPDENYVINIFNLENTSKADLEGVYFASKWDCDMGGSLEYLDDLAAYNATDRIAYMYDSDDSVPGYLGFKFLNCAPSACHYWDINSDPTDDEARFQLMSDAVFDPDTPTPNDYRFLLCTGPFDLSAGESKNISFVYTMGDGYEDLRASILSAQSRYEEINVDVKLTYFTATSNSDGSVSLNWAVEEEEESTAFQLYRRAINPQISAGELPESSAANYVKDWTLVNPSPITGSSPYSYTDRSAESNTTYVYRVTEVKTPDLALGSATCTTGEQPTTLSLSISPNPISDLGTISFTLPISGNTVLSLYDISGRLVETVLRDELEAGKHQIQFYASQLTSGVYVLQLNSMDKSIVRNLVIAK